MHFTYWTTQKLFPWQHGSHIYTSLIHGHLIEGGHLYSGFPHMIRFTVIFLVRKRVAGLWQPKRSNLTRGTVVEFIVVTFFFLLAR